MRAPLSARFSPATGPGPVAWLPVLAILVLALGGGGKLTFAGPVARGLILFSALWVFRSEKGRDLWRHPASAGAAGLLLCYTLSGILSPAPLAAWTAVSNLWTGVALAAVGLTVWQESHRRWVEWIMGAGVVIQSLFLLWGWAHGAAPLLLFPGNPQYVSFWASGVFFLSFGHATARRSSSGAKLLTWPRLGWSALALVSLGSLLLLPVRSGLLALAVGLPVFGYGRWGRRGLIAVGVLFALGLAVAPASLVTGRLKLEDARSLKRLDIWKASARGILERPLLGWGPGQFENLYWRHGLPQEEEPVRFEMTTAFAHNDFLQVFAESGIPGGLFALLALGGLLASRPSGDRGPGLRAAWAGGAAFACVNFPMALPASGVLVGALVALAPPGRLARRPLLTPAAGRWAAPLGLTVVGILLAGELALTVQDAMGRRRSAFFDATSPRRVESRRQRADQLLHSTAPGGPDQAGRELQNLLRWNSHRAEVWRDWGHFEADHRVPPRLEESVGAFRAALQLKPTHAPWWVELGQILELRGDRRAARLSLREALRMEPHYFDAAVGYGALLRLEGRPAQALGWLEGLRIRLDQWPRAQPGDSGYRQAVLHTDVPALDRALAGCLMDLKRYPEALRVLGRLDPRDPERVSLEAGCLFFMGRPREAERLLRSAKERTPEDPRWDQLLQRIRGSSPRP